MTWPDAFVAATFLLCATTVWAIRFFARAIRGSLDADKAATATVSPLKAVPRKDRLS